MGKVIELHLVGAQHHVTASTRKMLVRHLPLEVKFQREPENAFDPNAIKVVVKTSPYRGIFLGYVARGIAQELAPRMDLGSVQFDKIEMTEFYPDDGEGYLKAQVKKRKKPVSKR